jgi:hypothetical protein
MRSFLFSETALFGTIYVLYFWYGPTMAARSQARTVFARSNTGIVSSNPTKVMYVCVRLFYDCVVLCVGSGLRTG